MIAFLLLIAPPVFAKNVTKPGDHKFSLKHDGRKRSFIVHLPKGYDPSEDVALVMVLHGGGGNADNVAEQSQMNKKSDEAGFLAVYPNGSGVLRKRLLTWNAANCCGYAQKHNIDDVGFLKKVIEHVSKTYKVDSKRIFVTGMSNGGMMAFRLACELSGKIAAIAPVAAAFNDVDCQPEHPVSVIMFNGTADESVSYTGGTGKKTRDDRVDRSVAETIDFWIAANGCSTNSIRKKTGNIIRDEYGGGKTGSAVVLYTIEGGGHAWPGGKKGFIFGDKPTQEISANDLMWQFFLAHPKP